MTHPFFQARWPLLFAHRGGSGLAPENTLAAFASAVALGVDGIELDVRMSRDGIVVVHHDRALARTARLPNNVEDYTADELARADATTCFRSAVPAATPQAFSGPDAGVPALATVLARWPDLRVIIELKVNEPAFARAVVDVVVASGADERICLGCYGLRAIRAARAAAPHIATSAAREEVRWALYRSWCRWPVAHARYGGYQIPERAGATRVVSPRFISGAHRAGLAVQVWTVDEASDANRLLEWGADALISDRPDVVQSVIREYRQRREKREEVEVRSKNYEVRSTE